MKEIKLSQNKVTQVDDEDFEFLNKWKWIADKGKYTFYATRNDRSIPGKQKKIRMHRVILSLTDSKIIADHRDRNGLNNQRDNLRIATLSQSNANRKSHKNSTSKYLGVNLKIHKKSGKVYTYWEAKIHTGGKQKTLGRFKNEIDAAKAYNKAASEIHKEFANLNII